MLKQWLRINRFQPKDNHTDSIVMQTGSIVTPIIILLCFKYLNKKKISIWLV